MSSSSSPTPTRVLLVGHCVPDAYMLRNAVERFVPGAVVTNVNQQADLERELPDADLLLVNRMLDGYFHHSLGQVLIRSLAPNASFAGSMILISNLDDAQADAQAAGAMPGFGKANLYEDTTRDRLLSALDAARSRKEGPHADLQARNSK